MTDQNTTAFKEVAIISHPRVGEYAFGFITSTMVLQVLVHAYLHTVDGVDQLLAIFWHIIVDVFLVHNIILSKACIHFSGDPEAYI